jgi:hypothetical protein
MLGLAMDTLQRWIVDIGPPGPDKGKGGKYLFLPPGYKGDAPEGYFVFKSPTYSVSYGLRGFKGVARHPRVARHPPFPPFGEGNSNCRQSLGVWVS